MAEKFSNEAKPFLIRHNEKNGWIRTIGFVFFPETGSNMKPRVTFGDPWGGSDTL